MSGVRNPIRILPDLSDDAQREDVIDQIERFVQNLYGAETSQLNLNRWELRFDVDVFKQEKMERIISDVNSIVDTSPVDCNIIWEVIPTDTKNQLDGYTDIGKNGDKIDRIQSDQYPIKAFKITLESTC